MLIREKKDSPFCPGNPVDIEYFYAREGEISQIMRIIKQSVSGRNECIFVEGERGIGKSSLADIVLHLAEKNLKYLGVHCYLGGAKSLEYFAQTVFKRIIDKSEKDIFDRLRELFSRYIKSLTLFGVGVVFTDKSEYLGELVLDFEPAIEKIYHLIKDKKGGILLILDDLNSLTNLPQFSPFLKSFFDEISPKKIPITLVLVGITERRDELYRHQPSTLRMFNLIDLKPFNEYESKEFFTNNFKRVEVAISHDILDKMVLLSGGIPSLMHELGNCIFLNDIDGLIDKSDFTKGVFEASFNIGRKYIDNQIIQELQSETYKNILKKLAAHFINFEFSRKELLNSFSNKDLKKEKQAIDNFIRRMKKLNMIVDSQVRGKYKFINHLYHLYLLFHAFRETTIIENNQ